MGLLSASIRKQYLIAYKNELEYKMQLITQAKMGLSESATELMKTGTDLDPENPIVKELEKRKERLNLLEKKLDTQMNEYQEKAKMVEKEIESCDAMFESNLKTAFTYGK